ncbi:MULTISPECIES: homoserine dehydrogenase [Thioalkalivibrio]|uniref:Homoserine dehydrogenase n=1 Tax=Thioalkalivibrio halophilus TaxID=252474 RepID=A0A1V2ZZJ2_9GAMM|nr:MULTISPECIES: homoserine dehydrogenase [Thioalkalivibrio]OOC10501.1 homoserine dehydrogenase [Thioalkalivibrio halophilus]PYG02407.1 homoserine dehydrogenase [Thioalkalivibrio sp. ALE21]
MTPVKIGILGLGTVGCGTVNVLARNGTDIAGRAGRGIEVVAAAARDIERERDCDTSGIRLTTDPGVVVDDPEVEVVVELMGGTETARDLVLRAIDAGKHVVTANKAMIALYGNEIFERAHARGVMVAFEAAVAGGIPIIKAIREGLAGNRIEWLAGIINGTGNFILTEMRDKGRDFEDVLAEAQSLGYAEADPTFDVEGIDAAHKLAILASIAFGIPLQFDRVAVEGISGITREDVSFAAELGYRIKHLGIARRMDNGYELRVHPTLIPERRLIANVDGVMNAVLVQGDAVGPTLYYGAGAGAEATASAVVADLVDVVRALTTDPENRVPHLAFQPDALSDHPVLAMEDVHTSFYLRLRTQDRPGVLADITRILGEHGISIEAILQREPDPQRGEATIIMLTHAVREGAMNEAITAVEALPHLLTPITRIRMEAL